MMLVDTSVWIDYFNGYTSAEAERLADAIAENLRSAVHVIFNRVAADLTGDHHA